MFWEKYEEELANSGDLFYTWQHDIRWAATHLRDKQILKEAGESPKGVWELNPDYQTKSSKDTKYESIHETLQACGKKNFVKYFYLYNDPSVTNDEIEEYFHAHDPELQGKQTFRIPRARHIFEESNQFEALKIIVNSERVEEEYRARALEILKENGYEDL